MRISRSRRPTWLAVALVFAGLVGACGEDNGSGASESTSPARPSTEGELQILRPSPNEVLPGETVPVELKLTNARVVSETTGPLVPDEGHIHLSVDGRVVSMTFGAGDTLTDELTEIAPGEHSLEAEFVAKDHAPFANRVVAAVLFTVQ